MYLNGSSSSLCTGHPGSGIRPPPGPPQAPWCLDVMWPGSMLMLRLCILRRPHRCQDKTEGRSDKASWRLACAEHSPSSCPQRFAPSGSIQAEMASPHLRSRGFLWRKDGANHEGGVAQESPVLRGRNSGLSIIRIRLCMQQSKTKLCRNSMLGSWPPACLGRPVAS